MASRTGMRRKEAIWFRDDNIDTRCQTRIAAALIFWLG
jgi:hypothetical protein